MQIRDWIVRSELSPYDEWSECWFAFHLSRANGLFIAVLWWSLTIWQLNLDD